MIGVILTIAGIIATAGVPGPRPDSDEHIDQPLASASREHLNRITAILQHIDDAKLHMEMETSLGCGAYETQSMLDGTGGGSAYLAWPSGPVRGNFRVSRFCESATFDGGKLGMRLDAEQWRTICAKQPDSCGI